MERVVAASSLPVLLLGGEASVDQPEVMEQWKRAVQLPTVVGMVVGRALLYPPDGDVAGAVDRTVGML
jgi:DhnA family fructose-bisphosphate aldolase class Ia